MRTETPKNPKRQLQGKLAKEKGKRFENRLDESFEYYKSKGFAVIEKTPEPMKPIQSLGNGRFVACYVKKAQPDYEGTIKGGRSVVFEAKFTSGDRMEQSRVTEKQTDYLNRKHAIGARCFVLCGFDSHEVYAIPWQIWRDMKQHYGRKYVTEADIAEYRVPVAGNGMLMLLGQ